MEQLFTQEEFEQGSRLLHADAIKSVVFSGGTYHFEVEERKGEESLYPFVQIDDDGRLLDRFCTCTDVEQGGSCSHLAAAWQKIFLNSPLPLHCRFRLSFWNQLGLIASRRHGYDVGVLVQVSSDRWQVLSSSGKRQFILHVRNEESLSHLQEILSAAPSTEETSLKFSNLSPEELEWWRQGRPSQQLRYELSFWSDLAKWFFLLQDSGKDYTLEFLQQEEGLPKGISAKFNELEVIFYLSEANWPLIVESLRTVRSPLSVFSSQGPPLEQITYERQSKCLHLHFGRCFSADPGLKQVVEVGDWLFFQGLGFFPLRSDPLLMSSLIPQEEIGGFLDRHLQTARQYLQNEEIHPAEVKPSYKLQFLPKIGLKISIYMFREGDLQEPMAAQFGRWVYLPGGDSKGGFYRIEELLFAEIEHTIPLKELSMFIAGHRVWLSGYDGFQIHLTTIESFLRFRLDDQKNLRFEMQIEEGLEGEGFVDVGEWIYVAGLGFYPKASRRHDAILRPGLSITRSEISSFIRKHQEELETLPGFFTEQSPIIASGLHIFLNEAQRIVVKPDYQFASSYRPEEIEVFGEYVYVSGEGFSRIPRMFALPEAYAQEKVISASSESYFISHELEILRPYVLEMDERLMRPTDLQLKILDMKKEKDSQSQWALDLVYETSLGSISLAEVWKACHEGKHYLFSPAGLLLLNQSRFSYLKAIPKGQFTSVTLEATASPTGSGKLPLHMGMLEWIRLLAFEEVKDAQGTPVDLDTCLRKEGGQIDLAGFHSELRPYQQKGLEWLHFLYRNGLSGLLCDEMGLGKTHQAMALIAAIYNKKPKQGIVLVVCPTSVIFHWQELFKRFFPGPNVLVYYGSRRNLGGLEEDPDILLTSYGTLRSERALLRKVRFSLAIFDEIQIAKNAHSQTHRTLQNVQSQMKIGLTGTPIENRLQELRALFDIVLPGYLTPQLQLDESKEVLARLVKPFILRRKKSDVLTELPEKTEEIAYCLLSDEQRALYRQVIQREQTQMMQDLKDQTRPISYVHVFSLLSRLKQICDHPCLVIDGEEDYFRHASGKWDLFVELLAEARESGQKVVIFSQYLKMLDIIEAYLKKEGIGFAGIRGATRNRSEQVHKFQEDPTCEVFVASLQAAGVGIDLVAASVVIHYDRWWNPAKENQATDRVHRMGQSRGVQVFKLVNKGTIEEHIDLLIKRKMGLFQEVISYDDQHMLKGLDREELLELFRLCSSEIE